MSTPRLSTRIREAALTPDVARTFADGLRQVMGEDPADGTTKAALVNRLREALQDPESTQAEAAPFEALWPHGELFLTACITIAVSDGEYRVEEARLVSHFAHALGLSARQLATLESKVLRQIAARGAAVRRRDVAREAGDAVEAPEPRALVGADVEIERTETVSGRGPGRS
jgi:hypothetical protein